VYRAPRKLEPVRGQAAATVRIARTTRTSTMRTLYKLALGPTHGAGRVSGQAAAFFGAGILRASDRHGSHRAMSDARGHSVVRL
jgi:hypothetical protein